MTSQVTTNLTSDVITREMQRVLHTKAQFCGTINRQYDDSFAQEGAAIGKTLRVRLPRKYTVSTGAALSTQAPQEPSTTLTVTTQAHVDTTFTTAELALDIDDFSQRIIQPAMSQLAAYIDNDALSMYNETAPSVGTPGTTPASYLVWAQAKAKLNEQATPIDNQRCVMMDSQASASTTNDLKGLFQQSNQIANQYLEGKMGRMTGFDFYESDLIQKHTNGAFGDGTHAVDDAAIASGDTTLGMDTFSVAAPVLNAGDVFTIAGVFDVHPETKQAYSHLKQFTVTTTVTGATSAIASVSFTPAIISTGAYQNISALPADDAVVTMLGTASTTYPQNLAYHKDAFTIATADLEMPDDVHFKSRIVYEGISMRLLRQYTIATDAIPARVDVLYGYKALHDTAREPQAVRVWG
jgi:hypothetical protein